MAIGNTIVSAFAGAADPNSFPNLSRISKTVPFCDLKNPAATRLNNIAQRIRNYRLSKKYSETDLESCFSMLLENYPKNWLLLIEILELTKAKSLQIEIKKQLLKLSENPVGYKQGFKFDKKSNLAVR